MSAFDDPTPCPQPRSGILKNTRFSTFGAAETSVTLPNAPRAPGLYDAKPRRPRKRQSVGWDPTVDIYEDTFALKQPAPAPAPMQLNITTNQTPQHVGIQGAARRTSALFAQPAQRVSIAQNHANKGSPKKRRLSVLAEPAQQEYKIYQNVGHQSNALSRGSMLQKEARRRTIYAPSDTTVLTIHPGASLESRERGTSNPRRSDMFLDLATLTEDHLQEQSRSVQAREAVPKKRVPRASLDAVPRRGPLQNSGRQLQAQVSGVDLPGQGGGKENVPPGGAFKHKDSAAGPKRLGKRASFIIPEKTTQQSATILAPVGEDIEVQIAPEPAANPPHRHPALQYDGQVPQHRPVSARQSLAAPRGFNQSKSLHNRHTDHRRGSVSAVGGFRLDAERCQRVPTALSVPVITAAKTERHAEHQRYTSLSEDIAHPEMYEENWLSHQEQSITQLVNTLFDKAKGTPTVSPSDKSVRQQLLNLYHSSDNVLLHKRLQASLRFGALSIPPQTLVEVARFKDDFGQRQRFLDLWTKTYDLESLQTAAEIVVGRRRVSTPRNSGDGIAGQSSPSAHRAKSTSKFLQTFLVQNQDLATRASITVAGPPSPISLAHGRSTVPSISHCWRRTALRSLMIIHLLDTAQRTGLLQGRNLFQATSPYKSSLAVLHGLCRLLIPSVGDVSRVISHLGYHLEHVQYPLEEFQYNVTNLATDLRDGVRLTRLVECLLYPPGTLDLQRNGLTTTLAGGDVLTSRLDYNGNQGICWPLSQHLKYPCLGRPQRMYNVEIALAALNSVSDFASRLLKDIRAADIVDGHREKTVKLLWGLVSRWGLGALVDFDLVELEVARLRRTHQRRVNTPSSDEFLDSEDAELSYLSSIERQSHFLLSWAHSVGYLHGLTVSNLTTSFADGAAYKAIAEQYCSSLPLCNNSTTGVTSLKSLLVSLGCSRSFLSLFTRPSTCPSKTTTTSLLAFLASRILRIAVPYQAALTIQRAYRSSQARWETKRRVVAKCLAEECAAVVQAQQRLVSAVVTLQRWWKGCVKERREGRRRWV